MSSTSEQLAALGLTHKEVVLYKALLREGKTTAYVLAQKTGIKRPTVYLVLDELRKKGLLLKTPDPKRQVFVANAPYDFIKDEEARFSSARLALTALAKSSTVTSVFDVYVFEGIEEMKRGLLLGVDGRVHKSMYCWYAVQTSSGPKTRAMYSAYNAMLVKNGIQVKGIATKSRFLREYRRGDASQGREVKTVSARQLSNDVTTEVIGEYVRLLLHKENRMVVVRSQSIATAYRQIFSMAWDAL